MKMLNYGQPMDWRHPLNRQLYGCWKIVPWYASGPRVIDLARFPTPNHGTLNSGAVWYDSHGRQFATHSVGCTGGAYIEVPFPSLGTNDNFTLSFWMFPTTYPGGFTAAMDNAGRDWQLDFDGSGNMSFNGNMFGAPVNTQGMTTGSWWHFVHVRDRDTGNSAEYVNGRQVGSTFNGGIATFTSGNVFFGKHGGTGSNFDGYYDDIRFWTLRALSADDVWRLYQANRQLQDPTLSWIEDDDLFGVTAAGGTAVPVFYRQRQMQGMAS